MEHSNPVGFLPGYSYETLKNSILLIPSISIANVPQLTADVLLHTLPFVKVATLNDDYLHSFVSPVDYVSTAKQPSGISLSIELYYCKEKNLSLVQQRAPIIAGFHVDHVNSVILPVIERAQFQSVILFHLLGAGIVENIAPGTLQVYSNEDLLSRSLIALKISDSGYQQLSQAPEFENPYVKYLLEKLERIVKYSVLVAFAYEGDNFFDSANMAEKVGELLNLNISQWKTPVSWSGVYGDKVVSNAMEDGLYG